MTDKPILRVHPLGFPWKTQDPFLFCVYHKDDYPQGNDELGPATSLEATVPTQMGIKEKNN